MRLWGGLNRFALNKSGYCKRTPLRKTPLPMRGKATFYPVAGHAARLGALGETIDCTGEPVGGLDEQFER